MDHLNTLVSIILPNYNHASYLPQRLDSIFNQTYQNFEVIILDDCSTDNSLEVLESYRNHPKVSHFIVNDSNSKAPFKQWHRGLGLARGHYIWIAESDDFCETNFLESQLACLKTADVAVAKTKAFMDGVIKHDVQHPVFDQDKQQDALLYCPILNVSGVLFKAELLQNSFEARYNRFKIIGDRVFYFEYFRNSKMAFNMDTLSYFRRSSSNVSKLNNREISYYRKYFNEHCQFIRYVKDTDSRLSKGIIGLYLDKFFGRVRDRIPKASKFTWDYLRLYWSYKFRKICY